MSPAPENPDFTPTVVPLGEASVHLPLLATEEATGNSGNYRIEKWLGKGGNGVVHQATRLSDGQQVALKLLTTPLYLDPSWPELRARFRSEAGITDCLASNSNIVRVYESGTLPDGVEFIAMELLRGGTLEQSKQRYRGNYSLAAGLVMRVARAVAVAHDLTIIHRDLKPSNIMFRADPDNLDDVVVTDFGLAVHWQDTDRLTRTGMFLGTPSYASPEQFQDAKRVKEPTDVFALGVTLFHLSTGEFPFPTCSGYPTEQYRQMRASSTSRGLSEVARSVGLPECPPDLANICHRCLIRIDQGRIRTAASLANELEEFLAE